MTSTTARLSLYQKAEQELYKLDRTVKAKFYDFCHLFRDNPRQPGLRLKQLKGETQIWSARIDDSYRALLTRTGVDVNGTESWLVIAVRHRKDVYEQLSVAVNRITGEIEFVDLSVAGESVLRRAGISLTPAEPDEA
ncbi:MAG: type II toxin-antitoxin system RelE family toxin, partial [Trebonia sp.]